MIAVEGRSPPAAVVAAAHRFCMSKAAARAWITRLRKRGLLRTVAVVDFARCGATVESVAHIRIDWSHPEAADLEAALREDPAVTQAALTLGPFDYTVFAIHHDRYQASAWSSWLQSLPYVSWCRVDLAQTRFKRFASATALLQRALGHPSASLVGRRRGSQCARPASSSE